MANLSAISSRCFTAPSYKC